MQRLAVAFACLLGLVGAVPLASGGSPSDRVPAPAQSAPARADLDGDKLFDDLSARLEALDAADRVSVIVRVDGKLTRAEAAALERGVGDYDLQAWLPIVDAFAAKMTKAQIEALAARPDVLSISLNGVVRAFND